MSVYTKQINTMVEQLPISEQKFIVELVRVSINHFGTKKIVPLKRQHISTRERLKNYNGDYRTGEWDTGEPVGSEVF